MRYRAVISYYGAPYVGWQRQKNGVSVQETLEKALEKALGQKVAAVASGRTDAGVHAEGQVVHFDAETSVPTEKIPFAVNAYLPKEVSVLSCETVPGSFNARFSAKRKTYCYKLYLSRQPRPMLENTHAHIVVPLDLNAMRNAADIVEGEHDFKCFQAAGSPVKGSTVRTVYKIELKYLPFDSAFKDGVKGFSGVDIKAFDNTGEQSRSISENIGTRDLADIEFSGLYSQNADKSGNGSRIMDGTLEIYVTGNGFLYNMVRIIAGTLVYAGLNKLTPDDVRGIIANADRTAAGKTLPPQGLHLIKVEY